MPSRSKDFRLSPSRWQGVQAQHVVVVVGLDEKNVHLHDPALDHGPVAVPPDDFWLAWDEMEGRYATLTS